MSPAELAAIRKQMGAPPVPQAPVPAARPAPAAPPPSNPLVEQLLEGVNPADTQYTRALQAMPQSGEGEKYAQNLTNASRAITAASQVHQGPPAGGEQRDGAPGLSLGDILDLNPDAAEAAGLKDAADTIRRVRSTIGDTQEPGRIGGPTADRASPFSSEWGQQAMARLRTVPLQRSSGAFGMNVGNAQQRLAELYFMKMSAERGLPSPNEMTPDQYQGLMKEAQEHAARETAGVTGVHEQAGSTLVPLDVNKMVQDTVQAKNLPAVSYLGGLGELGLFAQAREKLTGVKTQDQYAVNLMAPFLALARPGVTNDPSDGHPVAQRESKLWWMFRLAPSTALASWMFDPNLTWEMGGEKGFGGTEHVDKIVHGYQLTDELPKFAEAYDKVTPWESGYWEKTLMAALPIGAIMLLEPDAVSVGTGLALAPVAKAAKEMQLGTKVMEYVYRPAIAEWKGMWAEGKSLSEIAAKAGPKGTPRRLFFDAVAGDTIAQIGRNAAETIGDSGGKLGAISQIDQVAGRNIPELTEKTGEAFQQVGEDLHSTAEEVDRLATQVGDAKAAELARAHVAAADAAKDYRDLEQSLVASSVLRGGIEDLEKGDLVIDRATGELYTFHGYRASRGPTEAATQAMGSLSQISEVEAAQQSLPGLEAEAKALRKRIKEVRSLKAAPKNRKMAADAIAQLEAQLSDKEAELAAAAQKAGSISTHGASAAQRAGQLTSTAAGRAEPSTTMLVRPFEQAFEGGEDTLREVSLTRVDRIGNPDKWPDIQTVMTEAQEIKKAQTKWEAVARAAEAAGDDAKFESAMDKLAALKGKAVKNLGSASFEAVHSAYNMARNRMVQAVQELDRMKATQEFKDPALVKAMAKLDSASTRLQSLMGKYTSLERQKAALDLAHHTAGEVLDRYSAGLSGYLDALKKGVAGPAKFANATIDQLVKPGRVLDGPEYTRKLIERYGADALDRVLNSPVGKPFEELLQGAEPLNIRQLEHVRDFESAVHAAAEQRRMLAFAPVQGVMTKLAEYRIPFEFSSQYAVARGYQIAQSLARASDWVGGTAIGRAPRAIRETVRRGYERFVMLENDAGVVAKQGGVSAIRDFLTTTKEFEGAFGNRDVLSPADKALHYLRTIAESGGVENGTHMPDLWGSDPVVEALKNAQLPSHFSASATNLLAGQALRDLVRDPSTTGAQLVDFVENALKGLYANQLGKTDQPDVVFRFVARAISFGSSQHDTMYDLLRVTGGGVDAGAARALNWFNVPEKISFAAHEMDAAHMAAQAYGIPKMKFQRGALSSLFRAKDVETKILKLGEIEGQGVYFPTALWEAMKEVPRDLAKELKEFHEPPNLVSSTVGRFSRLWRVSVVNGYVVPRAAYFVNNFFGDLGQTITSLGWKEGARVAISALPSYVPFVGPRLQDKLFEVAEKNSILGALFNPTIRRVMRGGEDIIELPSGPVSARRALQMAREDGCFDSLSTRDLMEATRRGQARWDPLGIPQHIELSARFMETIQSRGRLGVWLRAQLQGATRLEARDKLVEALYDWKTGIPTWEHNSIGRLAVFWSYRRNMMRQLGAALTEGFSQPTAQFAWKAATGQTKLARTMKIGRMLNSIPDMIYWTDPNAMLDDEAQLHELGMRSAPWWATSQIIFGNRELSKPRKLWNSAVSGRDVTFESLMGPAITTLDQLYTMNLFAQTAGATITHLSEMAGLSPNLTTVTADEIVERNIKYLTDMMSPGLNEFANNALKATFMHEGTETSQKGVPLTKAQAVFLKRLGWEEFMDTHPDPNGQLRIDSNAYGLLTELVMSLPPVSDLMKNWMIFADNPGYQESFQTGMMEALQSWTGLARPQAFDPFTSMDYESAEKERRLKDMLSEERKRTLPKSALQQR